MTTTQPTTYVDLYTDLQQKLREQTGSGTGQDVAKRAINTALQDMHIGFGEQFPWAERQAKLVTQTRYTTGTVTATKGSASIAGAGTAWNTNNDFGVANMRAGGKIVIDGGPEVYEIDAVASDTAATIDAKWVRDTASAVGYVYFEDEYALHADFLRPLDLQNFDTRHEIKLIGRKTFRERYPRNQTTGKPRVATIQDKAFSGSTTPVRKVRFWMPPDAAYVIPYAFVTNKLVVQNDGTAAVNLVNDTDEPIVPLRYRHAIVYHGLYHLYRDRKDDARAGSAKAEYTDLMIRIASDAEVGAKRPRFAPMVAPYKQAARRPYRGRGGRRYTTGSAFDQLRD